MIEEMLLKISDYPSNKGKMYIGRTQVLKSAAGYYIGRLCYQDGCAQPYSRESGYFKNKNVAQAFCNTGQFDREED